MEKPKNQAQLRREMFYSIGGSAIKLADTAISEIDQVLADSRLLVGAIKLEVDPEPNPVMLKTAS